MSSYTISFKSIKQKQETFEFCLNDAFWKSIESDEISKGQVAARVFVNTAREGTFDLHLEFEGVVEVPCDRCLDPLEIEVDCENDLVVKYGPEFRDDGDDIIIVDERDASMDMSQILYELVVLSLPVTRKHPREECNPDILAYLCTDEPKEEEGRVWNDPRWEALKPLKKKIN